MSVTHEGQGIADLPGKKVFVAGALAGEQVRLQRRKRRRNYDEAELLDVLEASEQRLEPRCEAFGRCGGCVFQHVSIDEQRKLKETSLKDSLERIGKVSPDRWLPPLVVGDGWHYRRRARLAVKHVHGKGRVLVGFRERHAPFITDMQRCEVLGQPVDALILPLSELIDTLSIRARLPQVEVAIADNAVELVFRVLDPPSDSDLEKLIAFGKSYDLRIALQPKGPDSVYALFPAEPQEALRYRLDAFDVDIEFLPTDFVQVNAQVNAAMVGQAIEHLDVDASHRVLDLFCGIGNFTLPLARRAGDVIGIEGEARQVERASANAALNGIGNAHFRCADLFKVTGDEDWIREGCDRLLLDPARSGADAAIAHTKSLNPEKIVYVSCHPGTLARDAGMLVSEFGYSLEAAGIIDMFPHTAHVESMAVFQRNS